MSTSRTTRRPSNTSRRPLPSALRRSALSSWEESTSPWAPLKTLSMSTRRQSSKMDGPGVVVGPVRVI